MAKQLQQAQRRLKREEASGREETSSVVSSDSEAAGAWGGESVGSARKHGRRVEW